MEAAVARYPDIIAIVVTGYGTVKDAVEVIKRGAWDFVSKPFQIDELLHVLDSALEQRRLKSENAYLRAQLEERYRFEGVIGKGRAMAHLFQLLETVSRTNSTILISGETGTGKEVVARAIHHNSPRRMHRFVALNCSAIPETLLEAELFGHVRGAFTGAIGNRQGRLEQAHKGTLFLDEVGTMSAALQMKLLRVLQEREFDRVGDSHTTKVDVRVIAATNSDLGKMVADGLFREDLFYRLNVIPVQLPALRERKEDIPLLVQHFLEKLRPPRCRRAEPSPCPRKPSVSSWPTRGLATCVSSRMPSNAPSRSAPAGRRLKWAICRRRFRRPSEPPLTSAVSLPEDGLDLERFVAGVERELIEQSLARTGGNRERAARLLSMKRTTLVEKLKRMNRTSSRNLEQLVSGSVRLQRPITFG